MCVCVCVCVIICGRASHITVLTNTLIATVTSFEDVGMKSEECCDTRFQGEIRDTPFYYGNFGALAADSFLQSVVVCVLVNVKGVFDKYMVVLK